MITNNLNVASILSDNPACEVIVAGGSVRLRDRAIVGEATVDFIRQFKVDIALIGVSSIEDDGTLRDFDLREVKVAQTIIAQAREVWLAADASKFNRPAMIELAKLSQIDCLFTDAAPPPPFPELLERAPGTLRDRARHLKDSCHDLPAGPRPGHLQLAQHRVRRARAASSPWPSGADADLPAARLGRARPDGDLAQPAGHGARGAGQGRARRPATSMRVGITNQRETTLLWNRKTGQPVHHAIVWQDRRAEPLCAQLRAEGMADAIREKTGLVIDAYFSGTKLRWLLDNVPGARAAGRARRTGLRHGRQLAACGSSPAASVHVTDVSNASRTMLFDVHTQRTGMPSCCRLLDIPASLMPRGQPSSAHFGDTDAALLGRSHADRRRRGRPAERPVRPGLLRGRHGQEHLRHRLLPADAHGRRVPALAQRPAGDQRGADQRHAAVRDGRQRVRRRRGGAVAARRPARRSRAAAQVQALAESVPDAGGVMMVPAFTGLGAPYWNADARGTITGLTRGTTVAHIARAALESIAYQSAALLQAMSRDAVAAGGAPVAELRVDGGACVNDLLMQFQADLLGIPVVRPAVTETTALGAAYLAGLSTGVYSDVRELSELWRVERRFMPTLSRPRPRRRWPALGAGGAAGATLV